MASESVVVIGHLKTTSKTARDKAIKQFAAIVEYSEAEEPGVHRYAITVPTDKSDETTIYAIEEYADQKVSDDHLAASPVQELIALFGSQPAVLADAPKVYQFGYVGDSIFSRPEVKNHPEALVVFAVSKQQTEDQAVSMIETWKSVVDNAQSNESETLLYGLLRDREDKTQIGSVEVYVNRDAFDKHCESKSVEGLLSIAREVGADMTFVTLKLSTGWFMR